MFCPDELKLNKLVQVDIPKPRDMFANYGLHDSAASIYSGDACVERAMTKTEELGKIQALERKRLATEDTDVD